MRFDGNDMIRWGIAGLCSLACHVAVIMFFVWTGSSSTPPPPLEPSPLSDVGQQEAPIDAPPADVASGVPQDAAAAEPTGVAAPTATPPRASASSRTAPLSSAAPATPGAVKTREYTVKAGDNLTHLARKCGSTPAEIAKLNGVDEKTMANLKVGQIIKLKASE